MKIRILAVVTAIVVTSCNNTGVQPKGDELTEAEVKAWVDDYDDSWEKRDTTFMKQVMDEHYIYFTSTGSTISRNEIINWFTPADKYKVDTAARSEISVRIHRNTAVVSSRWTGSGTFGNERFNDDQRCGLVLMKESGQICIILENCTQINQTAGQ
jgi:hypothetical protein